MKVTILGCGGSAGVPMIGGDDGSGIWGCCDPSEPRNRRTRASIFLEMDNGENILIDTGPDLRHQLLSNGISAFRWLFFTHAHADHVAGLDDVRGINRVIKEPIKAFARRETLDDIRNKFGYVFQPWTPPSFFRAVVEANCLPDYGHFNMAGYRFTVFGQIHGKVSSAGLRCGRFAYSTDVVELSDQALEALAGVETWVVGCFQRERHVAHAWLERIVEWQAIIKPQRIILTHMGPDMDWQWMEKNLPSGIEAAWDGMKLCLPQAERGMEEI